MSRWPVLILISTFLISFNEAATTSSSFLSTADRERLKQVFISAWNLEDIASVHYSILGYKLLASPLPNSQAVCKFLLDSANKESSLESYYYISSAWKTVGSCSGSLPTNKFVEAATKVLKQDTAGIYDLYYAVHIYKSAGQSLAPYVTNIKNVIQALLKKDDAISHLAYSFHIAVQLGNDGKFAFDRIEDALVQADEVDGRFLQFEGGLSITALLISGAYRLAQAVNTAPPISGDQAVKFANYFLSRRSVQTAKGAYNLLDVITILSDNKYHIPVAITLAGPAVVSLAEPKVSVKVTDLLGRALPSGPLQVTAESATRIADDVVVLSKKKFEQSPADSMVHTINLMEVKPEPGLYKVTVNSVPTKADPRLVGNVGITLPIKVMCSVAVDSFEIGIGDSDQTTQPKFDKIAYDNKLGKKLEVDTLQKLVVRFSLKDKASGKPMVVHQAFVRFSNPTTKQEIIFIAEPDSNKLYKFDLDVGAKQGDFKQLSGVYAAELIVGDVVISNSFSWHFADVNLKLPLDASKLPAPYSLHKPKPVIEHLFREPEKRPPVFVSNLFTGLVFVPFSVLIGLWVKLGVNISNFPFSLSALGFHVGLGAIFVLFGFFWLQLNMFQTLKYLLGLGVVTFLCGNKLLTKIANNRKHH